MGQIAIIPITRIATAAGVNYLYLRVGPGKLRSIQARNCTRGYMRIVLYLCSLRDLPAAILSTTSAAGATSLGNGIQGSLVSPVTWQGELNLAPENSVVMARFGNVEIGDTLELIALIEPKLIAHEMGRR